MIFIMSTAHTSPPLAVIGGGAMASAILRGTSEANVLGPVCVAEPDAARRAAFPNAVASAEEALRWLAETDTKAHPGQILLAVKPQILTDVARAIAPLVGERVVISILAGVTTEHLRSSLGGRCPVVRVMPNTPAQVRRGCSALALGQGTTDAHADFAERLFKAVGDVVIRLEEPMMDAFTAVAGSGPAYLFYLAEAMQRGADSVGFDAETARTIVEQTIIGAAELLRTDGSPAADLRARVTSKKGTTQAATDTFDRLGVMEAFVKGVVAARDRGRELGQS